MNKNKKTEKYHKQNPNLPLCSKCGYLQNSCMCNFFEKKFDTETKITLLIHYKEYIRITNTGKLIQISLKNMNIVKIGEKENPIDKNLDKIILKNYLNIVLFPTANIELNKFIADNKKTSNKKKINLIIPDGTWRQASKIIRHNNELAKLIKVKLPLSLSSDRNNDYSLRKNLTKDRTSTFEAISKSIGILENNKTLENKLLKIYNFFISKMKTI